ncbi:3-oxoacyl-[acyl-carrier-protein] synthase III C-terminal domain-containing protein [Nocardia grenadensis]|uniref:3-oxoacyl-[acyl-carrier-protein] synthase III C-terminal domain-containing protein n=1 Tax=Nocardia grenadensis TaxID=931537 RepID=UPI003D748C58
MALAKRLPYAITGISAVVAEPTPIDEWAANAQIPNRKHPDQSLTGADITRILGLRSKSWDPEIFSSLGPAVSAARRALASAGIEPQDIDTLITVTSIPYQPMMDADSMEIARELGLADSVAPIGLSTGCAGMVRAARLLAAMDVERALIVTYNAPSRVMGDKAGRIDSRYTSNIHHPFARDLWASPALFSDGAAALVFSRTHIANAAEDGIVTYSGDRHTPFGGAPGFADPLVHHPGGSALLPFASEDGLQYSAYGMNAPAIKEYYMEGMALNHQELSRVAPNYDDLVRRIYLHQANPFIVNDFLRMADLPDQKTPTHGETYGNLITVASPLMLHQDIMTQQVRTDDRVAFSLVGGGPERGSFIAPIQVPHPECLTSPHVSRGR